MAVLSSHMPLSAAQALCQAGGKPYRGAPDGQGTGALQPSQTSFCQSGVFTPPVPSHLGVLPARALPSLAAQCKLLQHMGTVAGQPCTAPLAMVCLVPYTEQGCGVQAGFLLCANMGPVHARDGGAGLCMLTKGSLSCSEKLFGCPALFQPWEKQCCC